MHAIGLLQFRKVVATVWMTLFVHPVCAAQDTQELQRGTALWQEALRVRSQLGQEMADRGLAFRAAALESAIGLPERALAVLAEHAGADSLWGVSGFRLRGEAEYALGRWVAAARSFERALELSADSTRGILAARAGVAYEKAGQYEAAGARYARAASELPILSGWLAVREASVSDDTVRALLALASADPRAASLAARARGAMYARGGDTAKAVAAYGSGGYPLLAAGLALEFGDTTTARRSAYAAIVMDDTTTVRGGVALIDEHFGPRTPEEFLALADAHRRLGSVRTAAQFAGGAVAAGDSSAETLLYWGDLLSASQSRGRALDAYGRAAAMDGEAASTAAFWHGRTLLLLGRSDEGMAELDRFVKRFPDHAAVPRALYGMADRLRRERRIAECDSLNEIVAKNWPRDSYASSARMDLAARALSTADTVTAIGWYREEIEVTGTQRNVAQYRLGSLRAASGDSIAARAVWAALARADSLGYYGTIARSAANLPPLRIEPPSVSARSSQARDILATLDNLRDAYLQEEFELLLEWLDEGDARSPGVILDLAEGLIERGLVSEGIHLGWVASRSYTLNHPRVLRAVFPWPMRDLIEQRASELDLDPYLLAALIRQESAFTPGAVSKAGAHGLMQLMPPTAREVARRIGAEWDRALLTVADANLHLGSSHLAGLLRHYDNRVVLALAAYNAGGTPVRRWLRSFGWDDAVQFVERIPYTETRGYLRTVLRNHALYRALYPDNP